MQPYLSGWLLQWTVGSSATFSLAMDITRVSFTISSIGITNTLAFYPTPLWLKLLWLKGFMDTVM
ncbi:MAG TPA: hypothetical protein PLV62_02770 [Spirochaetota bacterium]|nr:hypothetical protein [Spirochaetota bacterium]